MYNCDDKRGVIDVSVIIATRDRPALLKQTLESLAHQVLDHIRWEVIVVDNGTEDDGLEAVRKAEYSIPAVTLREPIPGKNRALNKALDIARGDLLLFTDDDVVADPAWVRELHAAAARWPKDAVFGGQLSPIFPPSTPEWMKDSRFPWGGMAFADYRPNAREGVVELAPFGGNLCIRRKVFASARYCEEIGPQGSDYVMGSEAEFLKRLKQRGYRFIYVPTAKAGHVIRPDQISVRWLRRRAFRAGRSLARLNPHVGRRNLAGVPFYVCRRFVAEIAGYITTRFQGSAARCIGEMNLWHAWGHVYERRRMRAGR